MPISAKPVLDLLLRWLRRNNVEDVYITTRYLDHLTRSFGSDGRQRGINITYTQELEPLGTAVCYHSRATSSKAPS
jgi:mannose-1-phosphate guanylyltransferase